MGWRHSRRVLGKIRIRQAKPSDIPALIELQHACYPTLSKIALWREDHLLSHQRHFPEGQLVADLDGTIVGYCAGFLVRGSEALRPHTFREITGRGTFDTHVPDGDALYGAEIMVHPDHRRRGAGRAFYRARFELIRRRNLRYFVAGGRMPGYAAVKSRLSAEDYVREVVAGRREDRVMSVQIKSGLRVAGLMPDYLSDPNSENYATLLVWENPEYRPTKPTGAGPRLTTRSF